MNNLRKIFISIAFFWGFSTGVSANVEINETTFPDESFRNWVLAQSYGQDGVLTDEEIAGVTFVNVLAQNIIAKGDIKSLKGIEYFTAMTKLNCERNELTELDLSKNTALQILQCGSNHLTELDLSKNTELTYLKCNFNQLTALDVSYCPKLKELVCAGNRLTTLNASGCNKITTMTCYFNQLTALDVSSCCSLDTLWCYDNQLSSLDVSDCTSMTLLYCNNNQLTEIDVSKNTKLKSFWCHDNQLTSLNVSKNKKLTELRTFHNQITGEAMDALVASLPIVSKSYICAVLSKDEQGVMTTTQAAAAKAKGWKPMYWDEEVMMWQEYEGCNPTGISSLTPDPSPVREGSIYDLQGRRLSGKPARGIYIESGKKKVK